MIANRVLLGVLAFSVAHAALAGPGVPLGTSLGNALGGALGVVFGAPLPIVEGGLLTVADLFDVVLKEITLVFAERLPNRVIGAAAA